MLNKIKTFFASLFSASYSVVLVSPGKNKLNVIKLVREITGLSLVSANKLVESSPKTIITVNSKKEASRIINQLTAAGASVEIKNNL